MANKKITNKEVKRRNRNRIYRRLRKGGILSNPDLAYELNLSLPTVTQNTKELLEMGLIEEKGELESTGGRKAKALSVYGNAVMAVGIDITRNHIGLLLTNVTGEILKYERIYYPFQNTREYFKGVNEKLEVFLEDSPAKQKDILGIGISIPGIVDLEQKQVTSSHVLNIGSMSFHEIASAFSYPCMFLNDANAGAYAEGMQEGEEKSFFYFSLSNTVGGSVFTEGKLVYGKQFRCGEVGHMTIVPDGLPCYCKNQGCLDSYCTAERLAKMAEGKLEDFFEGLKQGKSAYTAEWEQYITYLAIAINNIHMVLDCDVVLGGYVGSYLEEYIREIRQKVSARSTFLEDGSYVHPCRYKTGAAALGAAQYVIETFVEQI